MADCPPKGKAGYLFLYVFTQLVGLFMVFNVICIIRSHYDGVEPFDWENIDFNWHPIFMTIGLIFLLGNGMTVYRTLSGFCKRTLVSLHAYINLIGIIVALFGLKGAWDHHTKSDPPIANMYSLHSWVGSLALFIILSQYVLGVIMFLSPEVCVATKCKFMPTHILLGIAGFAVSATAALLGLLENHLFKVGEDYKNSVDGSHHMNVTGILIVLYTGLTVILIGLKKYKRSPLPCEGGGF